MREIIFRGKRKDNGEWVEGFYVKATDYLIEEEFCIIFLLDGTLFPHSEFSSYEEVKQETVGQFTGMYDINRKKIFDGDIVRAMMNFGPGGWQECVVPITYKINDGYRWQYFDLETIEVIGNIHDNPELLDI